MLEFDKKSEYLICIDSDGTIMDTMTIKHVRCFGPCFIEVFKIDAKYAEDVLRQWNDDNLYTRTRGINRFVGLDKIINYVKKYGYVFDGYDAFHKFIETSNEYSVKALEKYKETVDNKVTIDLALEWSKRVNEEIKLLPPSDAFLGAAEILNIIKDEVDLVGVSSANPQAVEEEWTRLHIVENFRFVACQDKGTKEIIISDAMTKGYDKNKAVMLGDALGDLEAAKNNGILFFPIVPKKESMSWKQFIEEGYVRLLNGTFDKEYQEKIIEDFMNSLS